LLSRMAVCGHLRVSTPALTLRACCGFAGISEVHGIIMVEFSR